MAKTVQYTLLLKDLLSPKLKAMGANGTKAFDKLDKGQDKFQKELDQTKNKTMGLSGAMGKLKNLAISFGGAFAIFQGIKSTINLSSELESNTIAFETMLGSIDKAKKLVGELNNFANVTPYENADLFKTTKTLLAFGSAQKDILPQLQKIGDIAQGDALKMESLTRAFGKVQSKGKASMEEINMMIEGSGFNPLQVLADESGKSMSTIMKEVSKGAISFEDINRAMTIATSQGGMFFNSMKKQSQSFTGLISTLFGKVKSSVAEFGVNTLFPILKKGVNFLIEMYDNFTPLKNAFSNLFSAFMPLKEVFSTFFNGDGITAIGVVNMLATGVNRLAYVFGQLTAFLAANKEMVKALVIAIGSFMIMNKVVSIVGTAISVLKNFRLVMMGVNAVMIANPIGLVVAGIAALIGVVIWAWNAFEGFRGAIFGVWEVAKTAFGAVIPIFQQVIDKIKVGLIPVINVLKTVFGGVFKFMGGYIKFYIGIWKYLIGMIIKGITKLFSYLKKIPLVKKLLGSFEIGFAKGKEDFQKDKAPQDVAAPSTDVGNSNSSGLMTNPIKGASKPDSLLSDNSAIKRTAVNSSAGGGSSSGGGIQITIEKLVEKLEVNGKSMKESAVEIEEMITKALVNSVRNYELSYGK